MLLSMLTNRVLDSAVNGSRVQRRSCTHVFVSPTEVRTSLATRFIELAQPVEEGLRVVCIVLLAWSRGCFMLLLCAGRCRQV